MSPPLHTFEEDRLAVVRDLPIAIGMDDRPMKSIARQAAEACQVPYGMVSIMEETEQRFLACVGGSDDPVDRDETFCAYCILQSEPMVVENALEDPRFMNNPHVTGERSIRFYVGAPILDQGLPIGTLCVVDTKPHEVSSRGLLMVEKLADRAAAVLRIRRFCADVPGPYAPTSRTAETLKALNELLMPLVER